MITPAIERFSLTLFLLLLLLATHGCVSRTSHRNPTLRDSYSGTRGKNGQVTHTKRIWFWQKGFLKPSR